MKSLKIAGKTLLKTKYQHKPGRADAESERTH